jgi:hypothetical protein
MPDIFVSAEKTSQEEVASPMPKRHHHKIFSSYSLNPDNVGFENKEKEENIILMLRQHPIVNVKWIFVSMLLFVTPFVIQKTGLLQMLPVGYRMVAILMWYLASTAYVIEGFFSWYFNVFFITNRRVIDVDFVNMVNKRVSDAEIEKIQDVSYSTNGPLGTTLNFGDVLIQTASEITELSFERVPNPDRVAKILNDLRASVH